MSDLKQKIEEIINDIPKNHIFDTHTIIELLIKNSNDVYLAHTAKYNSKALPSHGNIGKIIKSIDGVIQLDSPSWSKNIHDKYGECACWKKL